MGSGEAGAHPGCRISQGGATSGAFPQLLHPGSWGQGWDLHVGLALEGLVRETEVTMHNQHSKWPVQRLSLIHI